MLLTELSLDGRWPDGDPAAGAAARSVKQRVVISPLWLHSAELLCLDSVMEDARSKNTS